MIRLFHGVVPYTATFEYSYLDNSIRINIAIVCGKLIDKHSKLLILLMLQKLCHDGCSNGEWGDRLAPVLSEALDPAIIRSG